jgi:hypothetical protein
MKKTLSAIIGSAFLIVALSVIPGTVQANPAGVTISAPTDGQEFEVESLPAIISVSGMVTHSPGTVNDMRACVSLDSGSLTCGNYISGVGNSSSFSYSIPVEIYTAGEHTLQASADKSGGGHYGASDIITITIVVASGACDEQDPPAFANEYLNSLDLPQTYASTRGQILSVIGQNHGAGKYGSCIYDYELVKDHVDALLIEVEPRKP